MHVVFTKTSAGEDWVCKKVGKPICNELFTKQPYLSSTMYHPEELAIYCAARIAFPVKIAQVKVTLQPVIRLHKDVSDSWWSRMRKLVEQARLGGPPEQFLTELPALLQALRDKGWKADMITLEPSVMKWRVGLAWKAKYDKDKKRDPNIGPFDPSTAPAVDSKKKYVLAVHLQPPYASSYMDVLDPVVSNSDFTFGQSYDALMAPCLGLRTVQDANLHVTIVAAVLYLGTEGEESWNILNGCTKDLDNYNDPATIDTTDRGPGALASLRKMGGIEHGNFWDTWHVRKNIDDSSNLYKADKEAYVRAYEAKDELELEECITKYSPRLKAYFAPHPRKCIYPCLNEGLGMRRSGSAVEGENSALRDIKLMHPSYIIKELAAKMASQTAARKDAAQKAHDDGAKYGCRIDAKFTQARDASAHLTVTRQDNNICIVSDPNLGDCHVDLELLGKANPGKACSRKCGVPDGTPCVHAFAAVRATGLPMHRCLHKMNTVVGWNQQYAGFSGVASVLPSKADIEKHSDRYDASLAFPPWHKPSGGRPKSTSRKKSASEIRCGKKRKQMKCTLCHRYCQRRAKKKSNIPCRPGEQDTAIDASGSDEEKQDGNGG